MLAFANFVVQAQELPTKPATGAAFPLGSKFTIKLTAVDSVNYEYSIIAYEPFRETIDILNHDNLFDAKGQDSTVVMYFCLGTRGADESERKKNKQVVLLMKNYSKVRLRYDSEMQVKEDGEFIVTSNMGVYPYVVAMEMWPHMIFKIALKAFRKG